MRILLIDTCGEVSSLALAENGLVVRQRTLPPRTASSRLVHDIRAELAELQWTLASLGGVGVVSGPGSFTGIRVGLAAAKGLCEVTGIPLASVSRLEALLAAGQASPGDLAVLDAGREEFYMRSVDSGEEMLGKREQLLERSVSGRLLVAEQKLLESLQAHGAIFVEISAADSLPLVEEALAHGGSPVQEADANYVRQARALYAPAQDDICAAERT